MSARRLIDLGFGIFFVLIMLVSDAAFASVAVPVALVAYHIIKLRELSSSIEFSFLLLFSITYPVFWIFSVLLSVDIHYLYWNVNSGFIVQAFCVQGIFLATLFLVMGSFRPFTVVDYRRRNSAVVFWAAIIAMATCLVIAARSIQGSIFEQSYDYELSGSSILFEYVLILILVAFCYSERALFGDASCSSSRPCSLLRRCTLASACRPQWSRSLCCFSTFAQRTSDRSL